MYVFKMRKTYNSIIKYYKKKVFLKIHFSIIVDIRLATNKN